jgi:hypothetical protein
MLYLMLQENALLALFNFELATSSEALSNAYPTTASMVGTIVENAFSNPWLRRMLRTMEEYNLNVRAQRLTMMVKSK